MASLGVWAKELRLDKLLAYFNNYWWVRSSDRVRQEVCLQHDFVAQIVLYYPRKVANHSVGICLRAPPGQKLSQPNYRSRPKVHTIVISQQAKTLRYTPSWNIVLGQNTNQSAGHKCVYWHPSTANPVLTGSPAIWLEIAESESSVYNVCERGVAFSKPDPRIPGHVRAK